MNIIDLFSGAGGLTFGFYYNLINGEFVRSENRFVFANEYNESATIAFSMNFPDIHMENCDIRSLSEERLRQLMDEAMPNGEDVDIIIGGPPCQSFSTVGQRVYNDNAKLYKEYLRILKIVRPKMFLFENVKGILSMRETFYEKDENGEIRYKTKVNQNTGKESKRPIVERYGRKIMDIIEDEFANIDKGFGYTITKKVLNAVDFGVPENRERVFIIGIRNDLHVDFNWEMPIMPEIAAISHGQQLTIRQAISDLPPVQEGERATQYISPPQNAYQELMRNNCDTLTHHFCGIYGEKIRMVIRNVRQGQGKNDFNALVDNGTIPEEYRLTSGYGNTYGRLVADKPSTTITNNMCTPSGLRCIHYEQNRALTPREGARIQSFPDWFSFYGTRTEITKQIGNAVPPLLAMWLAKAITFTLEEIDYV